MGHYTNNRSELYDYIGIQELSLDEIGMHRAGIGSHGYSRNIRIGNRPLFCALRSYYMFNKTEVYFKRRIFYLEG